MNTIISGCEKKVSRDWENLNRDVTELIFKKIPTISDLISCSNVCRSWCSVCQNHIISNLPSKSPVLFLPKRCLPKHISETSSRSYFIQLSPKPDDELYCFFNPVISELYRITEKSKEVLKWRKFLGLSNSWAIFAGFTDLIIFNAPTETAIRCPVSPPYGEIYTALVLGDPIFDMMRKTKTSHVSTVAMYGSIFYGVSYVHVGDIRYSFIYTCPSEVICFDGLLYAVFDEGSIQAWDLSKKVLEHSYHPSFNTGKELTPWHQMRLVDSPGELLLVSTLGFGMEIQVGVYKMDFEEKKWVDMDSLGDRAVFFSKGQSLCFLPLDASEYKKNCVYFEDFEDRYDETASTSPRRCIYAYNLDDGSVAKVFYEQLVSPWFLDEHD